MDQGHAACLQRITGAGRRELALSPIGIIVSRGIPLDFKLPDPFRNHQVKSHQVGHATELFKVLQLPDQPWKRLMRLR